MNAAFRLIKSGAPLIAINKSRYFKQEDGLALGTGAFVSALGKTRKLEIERPLEMERGRVDKKGANIEPNIQVANDNDH